MNRVGNILEGLSVVKEGKTNLSVGNEIKFTSDYDYGDVVSLGLSESDIEKADKLGLLAMNSIMIPRGTRAEVTGVYRTTGHELTFGGIFVLDFINLGEVQYRRMK